MNQSEINIPYDINTKLNVINDKISRLEQLYVYDFNTFCTLISILYILYIFYIIYLFLFKY